MLRNSLEIGTQDISNFAKIAEGSGIIMNPIFEDTWKELKSGVEKRRLQRAKSIGVQYQGVLRTKGWITFKTKSQTRPGKYYQQYIKLLDMKDINSMKGISQRDIIRLMLAGDIAVYCECPDFLYRYKYGAYTKGFGVMRELRYPKIRNPHLEGTTCKHLASVLSVFMMHYMSIYKDMVKTDYWKDRYTPDEDIPAVKVKKK